VNSNKTRAPIYHPDDSAMIPLTQGMFAVVDSDRAKEDAKYSALLTVLSPCVNDQDKAFELMRMAHRVAAGRLKLDDRNKLMEYFD